MKRVTLEDDSFVKGIKSYSYPTYSMQSLLVIMQATYGLRHTNRCWHMKGPTLWLMGLLVNSPQHAARTVIRIMLFMTSATSPSLPSVNTIVKGDCEIVKLPVFKSSVGSKRAVCMSILITFFSGMGGGRYNVDTHVPSSYRIIMPITNTRIHDVSFSSQEHYFIYIRVPI